MREKGLHCFSKKKMFQNLFPQFHDDIHLFRRLQSFFPEGQILWIDGEFSNHGPYWLVSGYFTTDHRSLPWVVGPVTALVSMS
jgi:hypothetical protein